MAQKIGVREQQLRAMREANYKRSAAQVRAQLEDSARIMTPADRRHDKAVKSLAPGELDKLRNLEKKIMTEAPASKPKSAPVKASASKKEKAMSAKKQAKAKANVKRARAKKTRSVAKKATVAAADDTGSSKTAKVVEMLQSSKGCTSQEVCDATGWAAVSIPPIATRAGLKLRKEKEGRSIRYFATAA